MISYIFKNKTKNIFMIVITSLMILSCDLLSEIVSCISNGTVLKAYSVISVVPYLLILFYLLLLKKEYILKDYLFPTAFAIMAAKLIYSMVTDIIFFATNIDAQFTFFNAITYISYTVAIISYIFCFIGTFNNFKHLNNFKIGSVLHLAYLVSAMVIIIISFISLINSDEMNSIKFPVEEFWIGRVYYNMIKTSVVYIVSVLFYVGLLLLAFSKKSDNIDITPYVEAQRAKKEIKKAAKLQQKVAEESDAPLPEIPDDSWRCMGCDKILPNTQDQCECGFKK